MKLYLNKTSPYARLTLVTAHEMGLADRVELEWIEPWENPPALLAVNPLAKIPALVTDEGTALIESGCICDYLTALSGRGRLSTEALRRLGLGRAAMDCAFSTVIQRRFNNGADTALSQRWLSALPRAAKELEKIAPGAGGRQPDAGDLAVAVAFDYIDFRLAEVGWRTTAPNLAHWVDEILARPSMRETTPG